MNSVFMSRMRHIGVGLVVSQPASLPFSLHYPSFGSQILRLHTYNPSPLSFSQTRNDIRGRGKTKMNNIQGLVWFFVIVGNVRGDGFVVPTEHSNGCVAIKTSYAISKILSASPSLIVMSFAIDPSAAYDEEYGPGSSKKSDWEHFQCALKIVDQ